MSLTTSPQAVCECGKPFVRRTTLQRYCRPRCMLKALDDKVKAERAETKRRKEAAKRPKDLRTEAQSAFNRYIRFRDHGKPCICCGRPIDWNSTTPGGSVDSGHYLSVGSAPHMRFVEANCHAQKKSCNRPGGTTRQAFRAGMVERIGLAAVEVLEADQTLRKYTADDLRAIRDDYRARVKAMKQEAA